MFVIIISISDSVRAQAEISVKDTLAVLWTSGDPDVAEKVCLMYTHAALKYKWFKQVILIVWGPSAKLLSENKSLQDKIKGMIPGMGDAKIPEGLMENQQEALHYRRILRLYQKDMVYLVKPKTLRYWLKSIALRDVNDVMTDLVNSGY